MNFTEETQLEIFTRIKKAFSDVIIFDELVKDKLLQAIKDVNSIDIDIRTTKTVVDRYYPTDQFIDKNQKAILGQLEMIFKTCYVLILSYTEKAKSVMWHSVDDLIDTYPEFKGQDERELQYLLNFRNMMRIALMIIPAAGNKGKLIPIAGRLEGSGRSYITGGGQTSSVTRRVKIYEREGMVIPEKRPDRARKFNDESQIKKKSKLEDSVNLLQIGQTPQFYPNQFVFPSYTVHHSNFLSPIYSNNLVSTTSNSNEPSDIEAVKGLMLLSSLATSQ